jgi:hypothetical protein
LSGGLLMPLSINEPDHKEWYDRVTAYDCFIIALAAFNISFLTPVNIVVGILVWATHEIEMRQRIKLGKK